MVGSRRKSLPLGQTRRKNVRFDAIGGLSPNANGGAAPRVAIGPLWATPDRRRGDDVFKGPTWRGRSLAPTEPWWMLRTTPTGDCPGGRAVP